MTPRARAALFFAGAAGIAVLLIRALPGLPAFGLGAHPYGARAVRAGTDQDTPNIIASVNFDQRALDTVGEELILFAAALGAVVLLRAVRDERLRAGGDLRHGPADVFDALRLTGALLLPVTLVVGAYVVANGYSSPGGGFQGGVVLASALHLVYLAGDYPALKRLRPIPPFEIAESSAAALFVVSALAAGALTATERGARTVPWLNAVVGAEVACGFVIVLARFFEQALEIRPRRKEAR
ncbi:putative monovalent cation/H+ antiporter subunit B [Actinomadura rubteroloni]|uniref:Putative monovalent cation/H+ antiporter subunit B n=1 Tax=Actinomadura rubteroloni TaxID=1926885 RepID=A0A2P4UB74_9ACTN|nr:MnhB domain-containing protein [Actinomadura rubteroloni]POM22274.1 putative monovalent cation/H+ antiporter subunit B [Actinomadura rubteroloni]